MLAQSASCVKKHQTNGIEIIKKQNKLLEYNKYKNEKTEVNRTHLEKQTH